jgi:hypothetical protein
MKNGFPYEKSPQMTTEHYLLCLLTAIVRRHAGELHLRVADIEDIEPGMGLIKTVDAKKREVVLRFGPTLSEIYFVPGEQPSGTQPKRAPIPASSGNAPGGFSTPSNLPPSALSRTMVPPRPVSSLPFQPGIVVDATGKQRRVTTSEELDKALAEAESETEANEIMADAMNPNRHRHAMLDDARMYLMEQAEDARKQQAVTERARKNRLRDGDLPFRTVRGK